MFVDNGCLSADVGSFRFGAEISASDFPDVIGRAHAGGGLARHGSFSDGRRSGLDRFNEAPGYGAFSERPTTKVLPHWENDKLGCVFRLQLLRAASIAAVTSFAISCEADPATPDMSGPLRGSTASTGKPTASARELPPLRAASGLEELEVPGFGAASVSIPLGASSPRPVIAVLHGHGDRPEWQCGTWRGIIDARAFVLCPRGVPLPGSETPERFTFGDIELTRSELRAALGRLKERFGSHVAPDSIVLAGYSLGADRAAFIVKEEPKFFSRVIFIEGALDAWTSTSVKVFAERGGERLMYVCAQPACLTQARHRVALTERAGVGAKLVDAGNLGHVFDGRVARAIDREFSWLVAGQPWFDTERAPRQ